MQARQPLVEIGGDRLVFQEIAEQGDRLAAFPGEIGQLGAQADNHPRCTPAVHPASNTWPAS